MAAMNAGTWSLGNRIWWSVALLVGPIASVVVNDALGGAPIAIYVAFAIAVTGTLLLPVFLIFDTDRPWWSDEVMQLPHDAQRSRAEVRKLTLWSGVALAIGLAIALIRPWG
jgi:hypothetical protein